MLGILHRLVLMTGKYKTRIRASYITSFIKGILMKVPLILSFFVISSFMQQNMTKEKCLYYGIAIAASVGGRGGYKPGNRMCEDYAAVALKDA